MTMRPNLHFHSFWANNCRAIRQCQIADKALQDGHTESAAVHYAKALKYFETAHQRLSDAEDKTNKRLRALLKSGNNQLEKALTEYSAGYAHSARAHYARALEKYDEALDLAS